MTVLDVQGLSVEFRTRGGIVRALDKVGFSLAAGETLALVGESGSGKSVTSLALLGLLDAAGRITAGRAMLDGVDLATAAPSVLAGLRGRRAAMIFQNPRASLNPIRMVGLQLADVVRRHEGLGRRAARTKAEDLLRAVGIPDPARRARAYPFQLSGGMCQRVVIAIAVAARPALLIADEPTTGLDVTTQATVMDLLGTLAAETGMATLLITHDLALAAERAQRIAVMHAGHIVETAPTRQLVDRPAHPYTRGLVAALPRLDGQRPATARPIGEPRSPIDPDPNACRYHGRCPLGHDRCGTEMPVLRHVAPGWDVACHLAEAM